MKSLSRISLIAPCGMNCGICMGYLLREKNRCPGCRGNNANKPKACTKCVIVNCDNLNKLKLKFCSEKCEKFPCTRLRNLDKRYRTKYNMSMIENLKFIKINNIQQFLKHEEERWKCPSNGGTICVHNKTCYTCNQTVNI